MRGVAVTVATALLPLSIGWTVPAEASEPACVTRAEFRAVRHGMAPKRVADIFGTKGEQMEGGAGGYNQGYRRCGGGGVIVDYAWFSDTNRVGLYAKSQTDRAVVNCVSSNEWRMVYISPDGADNGPGEGGTMRQIHAIFDTKGWVVNQFGSTSDKWQIRQYQRCNSSKTRTVEYHKVRDSAWWSYWG